MSKKDLVSRLQNFSVENHANNEISNDEHVAKIMEQKAITSLFSNM